MFIFLYGPDEYRRLLKKRDLVAEFQKKHSALGIGVFDLEAEGAPDDFYGFTRSQSIFESAKLAVLDNAFAAMEPAKLAKLLAPLPAVEGITILLSEKEKPVKTLSFLLEKPSRAQKFENLTGAEWSAFIKNEAQKIGLKLGETALQFLGTVHQGNSWALVTELQKLSALGKTAVQKEDLETLGLEAAPDYWMLLNGMKSSDARTRLVTLERLFAMNDPAPKIFNILAAQAGEKTPRMAEYDLMVKSGKLDYEEALLDFALG